MELNNEYNKIKNLTSLKLNNIICKILDIYSWKESKGEDLVMTLKVSDDPKEDFIFIKIFSRKKIDYNLSVGDTIKINKIRHFRDNFYILDKEGSIQKVPPLNLVVSEKEYPLRKISELLYPEYIKFIGILIFKQKESENLTLLGFIDYTVNENIKKSENKAFYENNMILYVRAWDEVSKKALNLVENSVYCLENLKVKIEISRICSDLSDTPLSKITEISDANIINEIKSRSTFPKDKKFTFSEHIYTSNKLILVKDIKTPGYYKIQVRILRHHPFKGQIIKICKLCGIVKETVSFKCKCGIPPDELFVVKYLARDESGECLLLCKNDIARAMLQRSKNDTIIELLVYCDCKKDKLFFEIRDLPNYVL